MPPATTSLNAVSNRVEAKSSPSTRAVSYTHLDVYKRQVFARAVEDFMPPRETTMLSYMEMLAVFETSRRSLLPPRYRSLTPQEVQDQLSALRRQLNH